MEDSGKLIVAKGLKKLRKVKKSPNLVTLNRVWLSGPSRKCSTIITQLQSSRLGNFRVDTTVASLSMIVEHL